ncbi:MAG: C25 family cysteine peptidase, partial [Pirellulaceae bacterium]|nr:C25 family cysteine peptidase [Pirellulaceae bacterium]
DGDGKREILIGDISDEKIYCYRPNGTLYSSFAFAAGLSAYDGLASADIEGDSRDEIVVADWSGSRIYVYSGSGAQQGWDDVDGGFGYWPRLLVGNPYGNGPRIIVAHGADHNQLYAYQWSAASQQNPHGNLAAPDTIPCEFNSGEGLAIGDLQTPGGMGVEQILRADTSHTLDPVDMIRVIDTHDANFRARVRQAWPALVAHRDVIHFDGHGLANLWDSGAINSYDDPPNTAFPLDFQGHHPVITTAFTCLSGNYQEGETETRNLAETFLQNGAAVYIGSTQVSLGVSREIVKRFYELWAGSPDRSAGYAWTRAEREVWAAHSGNQVDFDLNDYGFTVTEFNVYGDPKFGVTGGAVGAPATGQGQPAASPAVYAAPPATVEVEVPDFVVSQRTGLDFVEIPGGDMLSGPGELWLPYYTVQVDYPVGYRVQNVALAGRSGLVTTMELQIPVGSQGFGPGELAYLPNPGTEEWLPELDYAWQTLPNPDGSSTLVISTFPFFYNSRTREAKFYKNFTFDIDYTFTPVAITGLAAGQDEYALGAPVTVDLGIDSAGAAQDVVVGMVIQPYGSTEVVDSLLLQTLDDLSGPATFSATWNSAGFAPGYYSVETTLSDAAGNMLDRRGDTFRLGRVAMEVTSLTATPALVTPETTSVLVELTVTNTGEVAISNAQLVIRIVNALSEVILEAQRPMADLPASATRSFGENFDVSDLASDPYQVVVFAQYDGMATEFDKLDLTAPVVTVNMLTTNDPTPAITGTVSRGMLQVAVNGKTYSAGDGNLTVAATSWTLQIPDADALADGTYSVTASATDAAGNLGTDPTSSELKIELAPSADIVDISPDPRNTPVGVVMVNFSEAVTGVELGDFRLTRNGQAVSLAGLTLTTVSESRYSLDLSAVTAAPGAYVMTLIAGDSTIRDLAGNPLAGDASAAFVVHPWQNVKNVYDVNDDSNVAPLDVLYVINEINLHDSGPIVVPAGEAPFVDVDGDDSLSPADVLLVINYINARAAEPAGGEGAAASTGVFAPSSPFAAPTAGRTLRAAQESPSDVRDDLSISAQPGRVRRGMYGFPPSGGGRYVAAVDLPNGPTASPATTGRNERLRLAASRGGPRVQTEPRLDRPDSQDHLGELDDLLDLLANDVAATTT